MNMPITFRRSRVRRIPQNRINIPVIGQTVTTGIAEVDCSLPGNGWPLASLTQLVIDQVGESDINLLKPTLQRVLRYSHRRVALISPPRLTLATHIDSLGLTDSDSNNKIWTDPSDDKQAAFNTALDALRSGAFGVVILWLEGLSGLQKRQLDRAADEGHCLAFLCTKEAPKTLQNSAPGLCLEISVNTQTDGWHISTLSSQQEWAPSFLVHSGAKAA